MRMKLLAATAIAATAMAGPALAMGPHARSEAVQQRQHEARMYHHTYRQPGFWPGEVAAGVVGGAIGTAGAIAAAPFGYDTYYDGPYPYAW
jgi:hypothetical protein